MLVSVLANVGILLLNVYLVLKISGGLLKPNQLTNKQTMIFVLLESIMGVSLIFASFKINDVYFDYRIIIYVLSLKYLGPKISLPTILIVTLSRFFFGSIEIASYNLLASIILIITIMPIFKWTKKITNSRGQLFFLASYYTLLTFPFVYPIIKESSYYFVMFICMIALGAILLIIIHNVIHDVNQLSKLSIIDGLTRLYNARKLHQDLELLSRQKKLYAVIVLDIDNFKSYNDNFGHLVGDEVIKEVSRKLSGIFGCSKQFYRYGGEEFVTIIESNGDSKPAYEIASRIQTEIQAIEVTLDNREKLKVTASIGIAYQWEKEPLISTFKRADQALFVAKFNGKNQIAIN